MICVGGLSQEVQCESSVLPLPQQEQQPQQESGVPQQESGVPQQESGAPQQESGCNSRGVTEHTSFGMFITVAANCDLSALLCDVSPSSFIMSRLVSYPDHPPIY